MSLDASYCSTFSCRFGATLGFPDIASPQFARTLATSDPDRQIAHIAELGFVGVDDPFLTQREIDDQRRIGRALARTGLVLGNAVCGPGAGARPDWVSDDPAARRHAADTLENTFAALDRAGGRHITVITNADPAPPRDRQLAAFIDNLKRVVPALERQDAILCLEPTSDRRIPGLLLNSLEDACAVVRAVDSPHVRLLFDTLHIQQIRGEVVSALDEAWDTVGAVQIADDPGRLEPGSGDVDFVGFLTALFNRDPSAIAFLEHTNSGPGADGEARALARLCAIDRAVADRIAEPNARPLQIAS